MAKYNATTETASNDKFELKTKQNSNQFDEKWFRVDVNSVDPKRYDFLFQNGRIVGIRTDTYDTVEENWHENGAIVPNDVPEYILERVGTEEDEIVWANVFDFERCENFTRRWYPDTETEEDTVESKTEKVAKSRTELKEDGNPSMKV